MAVPPCALTSTARILQRRCFTELHVPPLCTANTAVPAQALAALHPLRGHKVVLLPEVVRLSDPPQRVTEALADIMGRKHGEGECFQHIRRRLQQ